MATPQDAELILKLYELRTEATMREARKFVGTFNPATIDELLTLQRDGALQNNAYWRQALSYWDMAASFVLRGALDDELFADCCGEALFFYGKFSPPCIRRIRRLPASPSCAIGLPCSSEKSPVVAARYAIFVKRFQPKS